MRNIQAWIWLKEKLKHATNADKQSAFVREGVLDQGTQTKPMIKVVDEVTFYQQREHDRT